MLGIVGGMGPLASSAFLSTIYEQNAAAQEQDCPVCFVYSDPTFPDRTQAILTGEHGPVVERLSAALHALQAMGARKYVVACVTAHFFLPWVKSGFHKNIISLVDLIVDELIKTKRPHLLLCSSGSRKAGVLEQHPRWHLARPYVVEPNPCDQELIHRLIYSQIKTNCCNEDTIASIDLLCHRYGVAGIIAGCTELHLITRHIFKSGASGRFEILDPLLILAKNLRRLSVESTDYSRRTRPSAAAEIGAAR